jgi:membrane-associated progesterone receptor component
VVGGYIISSGSGMDHSRSERAKKKEEEEDDTPDPPRNFTAAQLRYYDGTKDEKGHDKPVYLSVSGIVFDVSDGRNFYGPDGPYEKFAGHECGVALAKMSFDDSLLDDFEGISKLNFGEKTELEGWIDKFTNYRPYPIKGKLVPDNLLPDPASVIGKEELAKCNGSGTIPDGYAAAPIYVGAGDNVYDMSFGGVTFYGPGGPYQKFAGKNASRALATMSLEDSALETGNVSDLTEKQINTLNDWIKTFSERKQYPVVGTLQK